MHKHKNKHSHHNCHNEHHSSCCHHEHHAGSHHGHHMNHHDDEHCNCHHGHHAHHHGANMKTEMATAQSSKSDPNGSYTGRPENKREIPVQDADDL